MSEYTETSLSESELNAMFAGVATFKDGTTQIKSGTLNECSRWADEMMKQNFEQIEMRRVKG